MNADTRFDTRAVHAGREDFVALGVHAPPIDLSSTYPVRDLDIGTASFDALVAGDAAAANPIYARLHNPTVARVEGAIARLEGTEACVAYGSGMAALTALLLASRSRGGHVLVVRPLYGTSDHLLASGLTGLEAEFVDAHEIAARRHADTALVLIETPANPTLDLVDIRAVVEAAGDVPVAVDSTFATPVLQRPAELGATYVLHSATKYLGGHADALGGVACGPSGLVGRLFHHREINGAVLAPAEAYALLRGMKTLTLRVERQNDSALRIARWLERHPAVERVNHPGLESHEHHGVARQQMRGFGGMLSFALRGGLDAIASLLPRLRYAHRAANLGCVETVVGPPVVTSHVECSDEERRAAGIPEGLVRYSTGIEDVADLIDDLERALTAVA